MRIKRREFLKLSAAADPALQGVAAARRQLHRAVSIPAQLAKTRPNARVEIRTPGGAWRRLYSLRFTISRTRITIARSKPCAVISATDRSSSINASSIGSRMS